jgi:hypothetical protein
LTKDWSKFWESFAAAIFNGGGDSGDNVLSEFVFLKVGMPGISSIFMSFVCIIILNIYFLFKLLFP